MIELSDLEMGVARARRIAAQSHDARVYGELIEYADGVERRLLRLRVAADHSWSLHWRASR